VKSLVLGIVDGKNKGGRPYKEWVDDIEDWCRAAYKSWATLRKTEPNGTRELKRRQSPAGDDDDDDDERVSLWLQW